MSTVHSKEILSTQYETALPSATGMIIRQKEPVNLESPFDKLDSFVTPSSAWWNWRIQVAIGTEDAAGKFRAVSETGCPSDVFRSQGSRIARVRPLMNENTGPSLL
jgi:hypothetical protein